MKKVIRLTESDLTRIVKRVIKETSIIKKDNGDIILGSDSFFSGDRPQEQTELDFAKQQLQIVIIQLNYLPNRISQKEKKDLKKLYNSYIESAMYMVRNNQEYLDQLLPMCERLNDHIDKTLNEKSDKQID